MPLLMEPRARVTATSRACRAIVATRLHHPGREDEVLRALQLAWFTTPLLLDEDADIAQALARVDGLDVDAVVAAIDAPETLAAYEDDKQQTRSAEGGPDAVPGQGAPDRRARALLRALARLPKPRRTAPGGRRLSDDRGLRRADRQPRPHARAHRPARAPIEALRRFPDGLVTAEVAAIMAQNNQLPDRDSAERALIELVGDGAVQREALADDALWQIA